MPPSKDVDANDPVELCGDDLLGWRHDDTVVCQQLAERLRETGQWREAVAGIDSVIVQFDAARVDVDDARKLLADQLHSITVAPMPESTEVEIPVCYGGEFGPDFNVVCASLGLTGEELIDLHTSATCRVDMLGFTPGFAYVGGLPDALNIPRLARPRVRVEAGSVGIADGRSGLYAMAGPGGWPLIGRTPVRLFNATAKQPFLLHPGMQIRFRAIEATDFKPEPAK